MRAGMESFDVEVLGGTFTVHELISQEETGQEPSIEFIRTVAPDRWFVMLDEKLSGDQRDTLALIDDNFEFQIMASGNFQGE